MAGIYETGIDTINRGLGVIPKYIASTATVNEVHDQARSLYGRSVDIFPPPGISCDDMYFAKSDWKQPGRMYLGFLAPNLSRRKSISPIVAALAAAPNILFGQDQNFEALAEAWWTTVVFNRSLRDVATNHNTLLSDVKSIGGRLLNEYIDRSNDTGYLKRLNEIQDRLEDPKVGELTSNRSPEDCSITFDELANHRSHDKCLDVIFATNMISVGLDVSRLALMVVNGQPQTTGEYIQVTSRIGRDQVPGLVVVNYHIGQTRSLAHYENFRPFHESFHRFVETSSITPFTYQVRRRALHAALVMSLRYLCQHLRHNRGASHVGEYELDEERIRSLLLRRLKKACTAPIMQGELGKHLDQLYQTWLDKARDCKTRRRALVYDGSKHKKDADCLLKGSGDSELGLWSTLNSMRNVEESTTIKCGIAKTEIRLSGLLRDSGIGSIVRLDDNLFYVVKDIREWWKEDGLSSSNELRYVDQVSRHPKINNRRLVKPPVTTKSTGNFSNFIPAMRFPRWRSCLKCGLLHDYKFDEDKCSGKECDGTLKQVKWVLVHRLGYLADVDWHFMAHGGKSRDCPRYHNKAYLRLIQEDGNQVHCTKCGNKGWQSIAYFGMRKWQQPWTQAPPVSYR